MNFVNNTIKLNNIKAYNTVSSNANQAFKKNFYSTSKEIDNTVYESIDYNSIDLKAGIENSKNKKEWYEKTFDILKTIRDYGTTFELSLVCGALELVENVGDALIMCGGAIASGVVSIWDEDEAKKIKEGAAEAVKYDWSEALYDASVDLLNVDDEIAHGITHTIGSTIGTAAAYTAISCIPGGAAVTASVGAVTAFGSASEMALNSGASFDGAFNCGAVAGIAGAVTGGALNKIQGAAAGATSIAQVSGYTLAGMGISALEPVINTTTQYFAYGKDVVDENGNKVYSDYLDYYNKSGGLLQTGIASIVGGTSTGMKGMKGYKDFNKLISSDTYSKYENNIFNKNVDETKSKISKDLGINKNEVELNSKEIGLAQEDAYKKANDNAKRIHKMNVNGYGQPGKDSEDMFKLLINGEKQETVFNQKFIKKYYSNWKPDLNGNVDVVTFKSGNDYDWWVGKKGSIGRPDGEFTMPKSEADKLIKQCTKNGVLDTNLLEDKLSLPHGTYDSGIVRVTQTVKIDDVKLPTSNLGGSLIGEWLPGGKTKGGITEGVVEHVQQKLDNNFYSDSGRKIKVNITDFRN